MKKLFKTCLYTFLLVLTLNHQTRPIPKFDERLLSEKELMDLVTESQKEDVSATNISISEDDLSEIRAVNPKKPLTFLVFMAADMVI